MPRDARLSVIKVDTTVDRDKALRVLRATYRDEKGWVDDERTQVPQDDLGRDDVSWFVVELDGQPVGVLRSLFDPPLGLYKDYGLKFLVEGVDVEHFLRTHRIAEVGRFAVLPEQRKHILVVAALMRAASTEIAARGYSHIITDVFENDPHSPYHFHTHVMGFLPVATHDSGELNHQGRRITLILDLKQAYARLRSNNGFIFRFLTGEWSDDLHQRMAAVPSSIQIQPRQR